MRNTSVESMKRIQHLAICPALVLGIELLCSGFVSAQQQAELVRVRVAATLDSLIVDEDTDNDRRITIDDPHIPGTQRGDKRFWMTTLSGRMYEVSGTYYLSNLLQELKLAEEAGKD